MKPVHGRSHHNDNKPMVLLLLLVVMVMLTMVSQGLCLHGIPSAMVGSDKGYVHPKGFGGGGGGANGKEETMTKRTRTRAEILQAHPTGSRLPDCSHACGPCYPCKRVMVSFKCSVTESCPVVYRCMCQGRYYPVPSN